MTAREPDGQPTEVDEEAGEEVDEPSGRGPIVVLSVIAMVGVWRTVVAFPEVASVVVGSLGTVGVQKARARWGKQGGDSEEGQEEVAKPDGVEALRRLIGDDKGVLLTRLQKDLGLPNTKADGLRGFVVGRRHDHVAAVADAPATDRTQINAAGGDGLGEGSHRAGFVLQLHDELPSHLPLRASARRFRSRERPS